ncbi:hypothetical protein DYB35_002374 [Aphanomyces astaci]|uniref:Uncharacterized protein n=1 Tax=Aphanomyces astaci TaxID=112090 RepID=A0A3R6X093_APHAT|nr:hypothetical protein DYB35_002374 [Aphanomyces astaci]
MEARKDDLRRAIEIAAMKQQPSLLSSENHPRSVESMFRTIDEKLELILDAQDARFRMLDDKFDRFNRRMDALERHSADSSPRGPSPVVEDEISRSSYETPTEMRRRLGSMETSSTLRRPNTSPASDDSSMGNMHNMQDTLRYIHERLASLETQTQALPDKITPAIHRRLDTLETQVKILPERVDSLLRQLQSRLMDHKSSPLHVHSLDPQRHHASMLARTEESLSVMHRTLETLESQGRSLPDRVALAVGGIGSKFGNYNGGRGSYGNDESLGYIHARLENVEKQVGCLPDRLQRLIEDDLVHQLHGRFMPLESQLQLLPERLHHAIKDVVAVADVGDVVDQAMVTVHDRLKSIENATDRLAGPLEGLRTHMDDLPHQWANSSTNLQTLVQELLNRHMTELARTASLKESPPLDVNALLQSRLEPLETTLQGLPNVLHIALEDNVSVVAMVVNDALAVMHRRLDMLESLPETLRCAITTSLGKPLASTRLDDVQVPDIKPLVFGDNDDAPPPAVAAAMSTAPANPSNEPPLPPPSVMPPTTSDTAPLRNAGSNLNDATTTTTTPRLRPMRKAAAATTPTTPSPAEGGSKPSTTTPPGFIPRKRRSATSKPAPPSSSSQRLSSKAPHFAWTDGSLHRAPEDWVFPITNCRSLWELWYVGDHAHGIGPYRTLTKDDIKHHYVLKTRGKAAAVVQKVIDTAVDHGIVASADHIPALPKDECLAVFEQAFGVLMGNTSTTSTTSVDKSTLLPHNACNNMFTKVYTMLVNQKRKRSDDDNGEGG